QGEINMKRILAHAKHVGWWSVLIYLGSRIWLEASVEYSLVIALISAPIFDMLWHGIGLLKRWWDTFMWNLLPEASICLDGRHFEFRYIEVFSDRYAREYQLEPHPREPDGSSVTIIVFGGDNATSICEDNRSDATLGHRQHLATLTFEG